MRNVIEKFVLFGIFSLFFPGCKAEAPVLPGSAPQAVEVKSDEVTVSWDPAVLEEHYEVRYRVIRVEDEAAYQKLAAGVGKWVAKTGRVRSDFFFYPYKTTVILKSLMPGEEILVAVLAVSGETYAYSVYPLLKVRTLTVEEESQKKRDRLLGKSLYPRIPNAITRMEYPEYHSFIYRYERIRDEQMELLEESVTQYGLKVDMANSQSLNSAGYGLYEKKDYAGAVRFFREAAYADPSNVYPHYNLACTLSLIRDSIWADPDANMDYHHDYNEDYYATKYSLYEPDDNYFGQADNDEICRNEIFEHLTLACLLDQKYPGKASDDQDLAGIQSTLRFTRLMENIQTGKGKQLYGIWYNTQGLMKESYFMLDGSMSHILPNNRLKTHFADFEFYADEYIDKIGDEIIQSRSPRKYKFSQLTTGYEGFDTGGGDSVTNQWDWEDRWLVVYSLRIIRDYSKAVIMYDTATSPEFDFWYFKDVLKVREDSLSVIPMEEGTEYINIYRPPYRYVMENNAGLLAGEIYDLKTVNTLAALAVIHDRLELLDMLINRYEDIDLNRLFLLSCLYVKSDLFTRLENGAYGFDVDSFLAQDGTALINYAAASGNVPLFESIYAKYYQKIIDGLSDRQARDFKERIWGWSDITSNRIMNNIVRSVREGKYNGNL
jgi:hypothetical protein